MKRFLVFTLMLFSLSSTYALDSFTYGMTFVDSNGTALDINRTLYRVIFKLWNYADAGGSPVYTEEFSNITVTNGAFELLVGLNGTPAGGLPNLVQNKYVELSVQTTSTDALVNLSPRKELTFTPLAIYASDANKLSGYTLDQLRQEFNPALDSLEFQQAVMALVHADATIMKTNVNHTITAKHEYRMANNDDIAISIKNSASTTTNNFSVDASGNVTIAGTLDAFTIKGDGSALDGLVKLDSDQTINGNKTFNNLITINHDLFVSNNIVSKDSGKLMMGTTTSLPGQDVIFHNKSICISTTSTPCTASQTSKGYIYAIGIETKGADYAEYFQAEETLTPGDIAGINPKTGRVRLLKAEDILLGVVSSKSGIRGNAWKSESDVLVGLIGQVPVKEEQVYEIKSKVYTKDGRLLGARLSNNDIYLNPSPYMAEEIKSLNNKLNTQQQEIENLKKQVQYLMQNLK